MKRPSENQWSTSKNPIIKIHERAVAHALSKLEELGLGFQEPTSARFFLGKRSHEASRVSQFEVADLWGSPRAVEPRLQKSTSVRDQSASYQPDDVSKLEGALVNDGKTTIPNAS